MWIDKKSPVSLETVKFLGIPFGASWSGLVYRFRQTRRGPELQFREPTRGARWVWWDDPEELFVETDTLYLARRGNPPINRD